MVMAVVTSRGDESTAVLNPFHSGAGAGFSDAFLVLVIPVFLVMALSLALPKAQAREAPMQPGLAAEGKWVANCSVPWTPDCQEMIASGLETFSVPEAEYASSGTR